MIEDDGVVLVCTPTGCGTLHQAKRETTIQDGQATLISNGSKGIFYGNIPSHLVNFRFSRALLSSLSVDIDNALVQPIAQNNPALRLIVSYAGILNDADAVSTPELRHSVALHMHDLAAWILGAGQDSTEVAKKRGCMRSRTISRRTCRNAICRPKPWPPATASRLAM